MTTTITTAELDDEAVCEGHYNEDQVLLSGNPGGPMFCDGSCQVGPSRTVCATKCGLTGTTECPTDNEATWACPTC